MSDKLNGTESEIIKIVRDRFIKWQSELVDRISQTFLSMTFENRFTLHPRRLKEIAGDEVESLKKYFLTLDSAAAQELGKAHAFEGLGENTILALGKILHQFFFHQFFFHQFFFDKTTAQEFEILRVILKTVDSYLAAYLLGFIKGREDLTLKEQERLRKTVSTVQDR